MVTAQYIHNNTEVVSSDSLFFSSQNFIILYEPKLMLCNKMSMGQSNHNILPCWRMGLSVNANGYGMWPKMFTGMISI